MSAKARRARLLADKLIATMRRERRALKSGDYDAMAGLLKKRERQTKDFAEVVEAAGADAREDAERVLNEAAELHRLMGAAREGARRARDRVDQIAATRRSLGVYGADGARADAPAQDQKHSRRA